LIKPVFGFGGILMMLRIANEEGVRSRQVPCWRM